MKIEMLLIPEDGKWARIDIFTYDNGYEAHASSADRQITVIERGPNKFDVVLKAYKKLTER
jgi:hypothetical protein